MATAIARSKLFYRLKRLSPKFQPTRSSIEEHTIHEYIYIYVYIYIYMYLLIYDDDHDDDDDDDDHDDDDDDDDDELASRTSRKQNSLLACLDSRISEIGRTHSNSSPEYLVRGCPVAGRLSKLKTCFNWPPHMHVVLPETELDGALLQGTTQTPTWSPR